VVPDLETSLTHTRTCSPAYARLFCHTHTHTHTHTDKHTNTHASYSPTQSLMCLLSLTLTHIIRLTHSLTHTHTHAHLLLLLLQSLTVTHSLNVHTCSLTQMCMCASYAANTVWSKNWCMKVTDKTVPVHTLMAYLILELIVPLTPNLGTRWR